MEGATSVYDSLKRAEIYRWVRPFISSRYEKLYPALVINFPQNGLKSAGWGRAARNMDCVNLIQSSDTLNITASHI